MKSKPCRSKSARSTKRSGSAGKNLPVDPNEIIEKLASLPIQTWNYKSDDPRVRHIGPMAQDFSAIFGVGDHHGIRLSDAFGVAYASIQALRKMARCRDTAIRDLQRELRKLQAEIRRLRSVRKL
jgi:hypothetical protein